jgi:Ca2+-binding RTX toxin-like protein
VQEEDIQEALSTGVYTVQKNNVLGDIANKFNTTLAELVSVNNIPESKITRYADGSIKDVKIYEGQELELPVQNTAQVCTYTTSPATNPNVCQVGESPLLNGLAYWATWNAETAPSSETGNAEAAAYCAAGGGIELSNSCVLGEDGKTFVESTTQTAASQNVDYTPLVGKSDADVEIAFSQWNFSSGVGSTGGTSGGGSGGGYIDYGGGSGGGGGISISATNNSFQLTMSTSTSAYGGGAYGGGDSGSSYGGGGGDSDSGYASVKSWKALDTDKIEKAPDPAKTYTAMTAFDEYINLGDKGMLNAIGGAGNDTLIGTVGNNWLEGGAGSDIFEAGAGDDVLVIDADDKQINLHAGEGFDRIIVKDTRGVVLNLAEAEAEMVEGGSGDDVLIGGGRKTVVMSGGEGDDIMIGGAANDVLNGDDGDDFVDGGAGNDILRGGRGRDTLMGGAGDDVLDGGLDDDELSGGRGNDVLKGGAGDDVLDGGDGIDAAEFSGNFADYRITRTKDGVLVSDTVSGRDGADYLQNIERLSFKDTGVIDLDLPNPLPADDVLEKDADGNAFDRTSAHLISKDHLLKNDLDLQGDSLQILKLYDVRGGTAQITASGDVLFTPDANYTGFMSFKYTVKDSAGHAAATAKETGKTDTVMRATVTLRTPDLPKDELLVEQTYLADTKILPVWKDYTGAGVKIAQFEPADVGGTTKEIFDFRHEDLQQNVDAAWLARATEGERAGEGSEDVASNHATMVAGVMVAANNGEGTVGVAYDATLAGYNVDANNLQNLAKMKDYDIANNSWGVLRQFAPLNTFADAVTDAVTNGRNHLGTVIVDAAGNVRNIGGNTNESVMTNNRDVIVVGEINTVADLGGLESSRISSSTPGASLLVSAPGSNIISTSVSVENENGTVMGTDYDKGSGTSFSAAIVSGVVALMLEANPNLGYRDVQEILALTARKVNDPSTDWKDNGAKNSNGGGMHVSHDYGFGEVDALAAVRLAETWTAQRTAANRATLAAPPSSGTVNLAIPDNNATGISSTLTVTDTMLVERAEVTITLTHQNAGDLIVKLVAPSGTESVLINRPGKVPGSVASVTGDKDFNGSDTLAFTLDTTHDWGESAAGTWTLKVIDAASGKTGTLTSWSLNLYGKTDNGDDTYVYTNEFASVAATGGRNVLNDTDNGIDTVNAAAVTAASSINLSTGVASIGGTALSITNPSSIENIVTGDGNDTLVGNAANNRLTGGRGNDTLTGGAGADTFSVRKESGAVDTITDFVVGVDTLELTGFGAETLVANVASFVQEGADTRVMLPEGQSVLLKNVVATDAAGSVLIVPSMSAAEAQVPVIAGTAGDDTLVGDAGGNLIDGGTGADTMSGLGGDDTYIVDNAGDVVVEQQYSGFDTVKSSITYALPDNVENLVLTGTDNVNGTGNGQNNRLTGNDGNNLLDGGEGADTLKGGAGNDTYIVDNSSDTVVERADEGYDKVRSSVSYTIGANIEALMLTGFAAINGTGNALDNALNGNDADNVLDGAAGADAMTGGMGDDTYFVDNAGDTVTELADGGIDSVYASIDYTIGENVENLELIGAALNGTGNALDNWLVGNGKNNALSGGAGDDYLDGGTGADTMTGGTGDDTYVVDNAGDVVVENADEGTDTVQSSITCTLSANVENLTLTGTSAINGTGNALDNVLIGNSAANVLTGGAGNDIYYVNNTGDVVVEMANQGTDTVDSVVNYTLGANVENLVLSGEAAISGTGNELNNTITGNDAANVIDGKGGADTMTGGKGDDTYVVDNAGDVVTENAGEGTDTVRSTITYTLGENMENLTLEETKMVGTQVTVQDYGWVYVDTSHYGWVFVPYGYYAWVPTIYGFYVLAYVDASYYIWSYISSGYNEWRVVGSHVESQMVPVTPVIDGTGNALDNVITGNSAANVLVGGEGNDVLDGKGGADTMTGGLGDDTYVVDNAGDVVNENAGEGTDTVQSSITYTLGATLENLTLTGTAAINGTGNDLNNILTGNSAANVLTGGKGDDTYVVDNAGDVVNENAGEGTDTVRSSITYTLGANVENLTLIGTAAINGTGNAQDNVIIGNGNDNILDGKAGADRMTGGLGNDTYVVDNTGDVVVENANEGLDTVRSGISYTLGANLENLVLTGTDAINGTGNELDNVIAGNSAINILTGGLGNDTYVVDNAGDVVVENAGEGIDTVQSSITYTLGDTLENLTLAETAVIATQVTVQDYGWVYVDTSHWTQVWVDTSHYEWVDVDAGGSWTYDEWGNYVYVPRMVITQVYVQSGYYNSVYVTEGHNEYRVVGSHVETQMQSVTPVINGTGNALDNVLTGNSAANVLTGGAGNDVLDGRGGADTMTGGLGDDTYVVDNTGDVVNENAGEGIDTVQSSITYTLGATLENLTLTGTTAINGTGNALNNILTGNSAANVLTGGAGNDTLDGKGGADTMTGGLGDDTYVVDNAGDVVNENAGEGTDTVQSSISHTLASNLENLTLIGTLAINGTGNALNNVLTGNSANNVLDGKGGADTLIGGLGDDTYVVDNTGDVVNENAGEGTDTVQSSISYELGDNMENLSLAETVLVLTQVTVQDYGWVYVDTSHWTQVWVDTSHYEQVWVPGHMETLNDNEFGWREVWIEGSWNTVYVQSGYFNPVLVTEGHNEYRLVGSHVETQMLPTTPVINGTGNAQDNVLTGNSAANVLVGGEGNDTLNGGAGADTLIGGLGNDTYVVDNAGDVVNENAGEGIDTVQSSITYTLGATLENLTLTGTAAINGTGNAQDNVLTGNSAANVLNGGEGNDTLNGGAGADTLNGGAGNDTYVFNSGYGSDAIQDNDSTSGNRDTVQLGFNPLDLILNKSGNNLQILVNNSTDVLTIENWYEGSEHHTEVFKTADGKQLLDTQVDQLIQAMASFCSDNGMTWSQAIQQKPTETQAILATYWQAV